MRAGRIVTLVAFGVSAALAISAPRARAADSPDEVYIKKFTELTNGKDAFKKELAQSGLKSSTGDYPVETVAAQECPYQKENLSDSASADVLTIYVYASAALACQVPDLRITSKLQVKVFVPQSKSFDYQIGLIPGKQPGQLSFIRGLDSPAPKAAAAAPPGPPDPTTDPGQWIAKTFATPDRLDASLKVQVTSTTLSNSITINIARLYPFNISTAVIMAESPLTYSVVNGKISQKRNSPTPNYFLGVNWYPFSWYRHNGALSVHGWQNGRYFPSEHLWDRISLFGAIQLTAASSSVYVGPTFEVFSGVSVTAGWQPQTVDRLQAGYSVGQTSSSAPTKQGWQVNRFGGGISIDASIAKPLISLIKGQ